MRRIWSNVVWLFVNLFAGVRLTLPVPVSRRSFHVSSDQAMLLLLAAAGTSLLTADPFGSGLPSVGRDAWAMLGARSFLSALLFYVVARLQGGAHNFIPLAVAMWAISVPLDVYPALVLRIGGSDLMLWRWHGYYLALWALWAVPICWGIAAIARSVRVMYAAGWLRTGVLTVLLTLGSLAISWSLPLYFPHTPRTAQADEADEADTSWVDTEQTYYAQPRLMNEALAALKPARRGITDLYFLGFAGTATQDVFLKEVRAAQRLFDERFGTRGRSLLLINNPRTVAETPVASATNLRLALAGMARKMNLDEDVLFLFLTSHGSPHRFSINFPALALDDLSDRVLKDMLDRSGIKWRVLVISACYSGSFVDMLKDERTLILTAAAADKTSFGCGNEEDFTYFGDAFINTALRRDRSFVAAFEEAKAIIARREADEQLTPSEPQIYLGAAIKAKLREIERPARRPLAAAAR